MKGNLTEEKADAVVNAANGRLEHAAGLARALVEVCRGLRVRGRTACAFVPVWCVRGFDVHGRLHAHQTIHRRIGISKNATRQGDTPFGFNPYCSVWQDSEY